MALVTHTLSASDGWIELCSDVSTLLSLQVLPDLNGTTEPALACLRGNTAPTQGMVLYEGWAVNQNGLSMLGTGAGLWGQAIKPSVQVRVLTS